MFAPTFRNGFLANNDAENIRCAKTMYTCIGIIPRYFRSRINLQTNY